MNKDPYKAKLFNETSYAKKCPVIGELVVVLRGSLDNRELQLIKPISRVVNRGEVHELIITEEQDRGPGEEVNKISYLGFVEIKEPGVIVTDDVLEIDGKQIGTVAGFDETHVPNHLNIVMSNDVRHDGEGYCLKLNNEVKFTRY